MKYCYSIFSIFFCFLVVFGQLKPSEKKDKLRNLNADLIEKKEGKFEDNPLFSGNVIFEHSGSKLYSDSAVYYQTKNLFVAWSKASISNDTVTLSSHKLEYDLNTGIAKAFDEAFLRDPKSRVTSDYMEYDRNTQIAIARGDVVMTDPSQRLETEELIYDRSTGIAKSNVHTVMFSEDGIIRSNKAMYDVNAKTAYFDEEVNIDNKDTRIYSKKMKTNQLSGETIFSDYSRISSVKNPSNYIITSNGKFNKKTGEAWLEDRSSVFNDGKELKANHLYYNNNTGIGWGKGDVVLDDPAENQVIKGDYGEVYKKLDSVFITQKAYIVKAFSNDSLYIHADTLVAVKRIDSINLVRGYFNVRFFKSNAQGKADSLSYNQTSGKMELFKDPIFWSGDQQLTGDTIFAFNNVKTEKLDSILVMQKAFVVAKVDSLTTTDFNQVKGRRMLALFKDNELNWIEIKGNAIALSFMDDVDSKTKEKERIGINISRCGIIEASVSKKEVDVVSCRIQATSKLYPEDKIEKKELLLPDFVWRGEERMKRWQDIFNNDKLQ